VADSGQSCRFGYHIIEFQVHQRIIGIHFESHFDRSSTAYLPIQFAQDILYAILSTCVRIWDMARLFVAILHLLLACDKRLSAPESPGHILS